MYHSDKKKWMKEGKSIFLLWHSLTFSYVTTDYHKSMTIVHRFWWIEYVLFKQNEKNENIKKWTENLAKCCQMIWTVTKYCYIADIILETKTKTTIITNITMITEHKKCSINKQVWKKRPERINKECAKTKTQLEEYEWCIHKN